MKTIYKFPFSQSDPRVYGEQCEFAIPVGGEIVGFGVQGNVHVMWALCEDTNPLVSRTFMLVGTGKEIPDGWTYRGTSHKADYPSFVWHWLERSND